LLFVAIERKKMENYNKNQEKIGNLTNEQYKVWTRRNKIKAIIGISTGVVGIGAGVGIGYAIFHKNVPFNDFYEMELSSYYLRPEQNETIKISMYKNNKLIEGDNILYKLTGEAEDFVTVEGDTISLKPGIDVPKETPGVVAAYIDDKEIADVTINILQNPTKYYSLVPNDYMLDTNKNETSLITYLNSVELSEVQYDFASEDA
jgi:hypothetical protein